MRRLFSSKSLGALESRKAFNIPGGQKRLKTLLRASVPPIISSLISLDTFSVSSSRARTDGVANAAEDVGPKIKEEYA